MFIAWKGRGILIPLVLIALIALFGQLFSKEDFEMTFIIALILTGLFSWYFGKKWKAKNERTVIDKESGEEFTITAEHSLFWINMEYWGYILPVIALIILFQQLI